MPAWYPRTIDLISCFVSSSQAVSHTFILDNIEIISHFSAANWPMSFFYTNNDAQELLFVKLIYICIAVLYNVRRSKPFL